MRIVVYCPSYFVGVSSVFSHGEKLGLFVREKDRSKIQKSDYLILGALDRSYDDELLNRANAVLITSTLGQMELMGEINAFVGVLSKFKHLKILCGHYDSCAALSLWIDRRVEYFPYPINIDHMEKDYSKDRPSKIGLFLPNSSRKNILNQSSAYFLSWIKLRNIELHTNLEIEGADVVKHTWLPRDKYLNLINSIAFMLHLTFTESLSYGVIDSINCGSIPIVSRQVSDYFSLPEIITINNVDSANSIASKILELLNESPDSLNSILTECRFRLKVISEMHNSKLRSLTETLKLV